MKEGKEGPKGGERIALTKGNGPGKEGGRERERERYADGEHCKLGQGDDSVTGEVPQLDSRHSA